MRTPFTNQFNLYDSLCICVWHICVWHAQSAAWAWAGVLAIPTPFVPQSVPHTGKRLFQSYRSNHFASFLLALWLISICEVSVSTGQEFPDVAARKASKGAMPPGAMPGMPPGVPPGGMPPGMPGAPGGPPPGDAKPGETKPGEAAAPEAIKRKSEPPEPPNKREFDVKPDEQGMLQFQFRNQAWPDLMRWLSEVSGMSLDWQELPGDYLNIATQKKHSLEETRDLFNRHLLARGFTILEFDGILQVTKTKGINTAQVPKVDVSQLEKLPAHRFVRVSFSLDTLIAADVVAELKPLISSNGELNALAATNRLEAMDTAANLAELHRILKEEQSQAALEGLAREFVLQFVRANDAKDQLRQFLGLEAAKKSGPVSPEEQMAAQQQAMMMAQQQQQQRQQGGAPAPAKAKEKGDIYLVANARRNSVIASAPPDKMAIIAAFVRRIDVPNENADSMSMLESRMKVYRLSSLDPKQLVASLLSMDVLEPTTRLEVDEKNKAIIAHASIADQYAIQQTIKRLDGSARDVDVIQLRRLRAEDVVGTIKFLMGNEEKKEDNSRRNYGYDPWGFNSNTKKDTTTDAFRVAANSQDNQVLIWANEIERAEVNKLLVKLGELPPTGGNVSRTRVIDANRSSDTKEYLKRLQKAWSQISPTPLVLPGDDQFDPADAKKAPSEKATTTESDGSSPAPKPKLQDVTLRTNSSINEKWSHIGVPVGYLSTANQSPANQSPVNEQSDDEPNANTRRASPVKPPIDASADLSDKSTGKTTARSGPPIQIAFDERGNLVLSSDDTEALSRLEQLMIENVPPQRNYEVFYIKNTRPTWIELNLKDYYKEDKKDSSNDSFRWIFGFDAPSDKKNEDPQLGKKRQLKFLSDNDTSSLIVIGADDVQLKTIEELIRLWDVPEKTNKQKLRYTKLMKVEYSSPDVIVEALKEAYRDLLSTNDKTFEKEKSGGGGGGGASEVKRGASESISDGAMNYSFSGRLSMGVDKITKTIIVSAEGENLLKLVCEMITQLDEAAMPTGSIQVIKLDGANGAAMEKALMALAKANGKEVPNADPNQKQQQQLNQQQNQEQAPSGQSSNSSRGTRKK
jgi:type II secretory pathway component GspD/PulD (secretin)